MRGHRRSREQCCSSHPDNFALLLYSKLSRLRKKSYHKNIVHRRERQKRLELETQIKPVLDSLKNYFRHNFSEGGERSTSLPSSPTPTSTSLPQQSLRREDLIFFRHHRRGLLCTNDMSCLRKKTARNEAHPKKTDTN